jgi:hypothetical protein
MKLSLFSTFAVLFLCSILSFVFCETVLDKPWESSSVGLSLIEKRASDNETTFEIHLFQRNDGFIEGVRKRYSKPQGSEASQLKLLSRWLLDPESYTNLIEKMSLSNDLDFTNSVADSIGKNALAKHRYFYSYVEKTPGHAYRYRGGTAKGLEDHLASFFSGDDEEESVPWKVEQVLMSVPTVEWYESLDGTRSMPIKEHVEFYSTGDVAWWFQSTKLGQENKAKLLSSSTMASALEVEVAKIDLLAAKVRQGAVVPESNWVEIVESSELSNQRRIAMAMGRGGIGVGIVEESFSTNAPPSVTCKWLFESKYLERILNRGLDKGLSIDYWPSDDDIALYRTEEGGRIAVAIHGMEACRSFCIRTANHSMDGMQKLPNVLYDLYLIVPYRSFSCQNGERWNVKSAQGTLVRCLESNGSLAPCFKDVYFSPKYYQTKTRGNPNNK